MVNRDMNSILLQVSGSMQNGMMVKGDVKIVASAQQLVYGIVRDVKQENQNRNFRNG